MGWKQRVGVVALVVLAGLPVAGTLCAVICDSAAAAASTHHGPEDCEKSERFSMGVQIEAASGHDCSNHDPAIRQMASTAPQRIDPQAAATVFALAAGHTSVSSPPLGAPPFDDASPPGTAPRTTTPVVLRV